MCERSVWWPHEYLCKTPSTFRVLKFCYSASNMMNNFCTNWGSDHRPPFIARWTEGCLKNIQQPEVSRADGYSIWYSAQERIFQFYLKIPQKSQPVYSIFGRILVWRFPTPKNWKNVQQILRNRLVKKATFVGKFDN